ncbi:MAG: M23 family metallopeptidase [Hellea sp.]|nr:M23 family metallopeptidase [Hellea sp.]
MKKNILKEWRRKITKSLPERQVLMRSDGYVRFFLLSTTNQVIIIAAITSISLWCIFTLLSYTWGYNPLRAPWKEAERIASNYEEVLDSARTREETVLKLLEMQKKEFEKITNTIEEKHFILTEAASIKNSRINSYPEKLSSNATILMSPYVLDTTPRKSMSKNLESLITQSEPTTYASLNSIQKAQNELLFKNENEILDVIELKRAVIISTGLLLSDVLNNADDGLGGPLIKNKNDMDTETPHNIQNFKLRIKEAMTLSDVVNSLPTGYPTTSIKRSTSPFGKRKDPFTNQYTEHQGIDFGTGGERDSIVISSSDGKIIFKGDNGGYGHSIKIDHGYGLVTIYAHLKRNNDGIDVGDYVKRGDKIGIMGSTGRSTATHLHYEVHFNGSAIDPNRFLKAGYYVQ